MPNLRDAGATEDERILRVLRDIAIDMEVDASKFDGQPFTGKTVGEYFGYQGAAIAALAKVLSRLIERSAVRPQGDPNE